ncbi:MAG TPA: 4-hydroxy-3-methylbut-2-enyl diphosphate reductase [Actinobacteria bacterium]|nr:4-hydroxy-3-methylbut-2-enyl diphosphate reductase [Actinomycetota bacterium]
MRVILAQPRGFCAGVVRAIDVVEKALVIYGAPLYVRHEIVHNKHVVDSLKAKGVVFISHLAEAPAGDRPVIFSAHGVAKAVSEEAKARNLLTIDATCPLVTKVHREAQVHFKRGRKVILIGHVGHPEVVGTTGQLPAGAVTLVRSTAEVEGLRFDPEAALAYVTQTTLSVDDTREIVAALKRRFPHIHAPPLEDICYATTNRQLAVRAIAAESDLVLVAGSANSSNSRRLVETAERAGTPAYLVDDTGDIELGWLAGKSTIGITAGASAPPAMVGQIVAALSGLGRIQVSERVITTESIRFGLPKEVRQA